MDSAVGTLVRFWYRCPRGGHWVEALGCPTLHTVGSSCATPPWCTAGPFSGHLWEIRFKKVHTVQGVGRQKGVRNSPASCSQKEEGRRCCGQWSRDAAPGEMRVEQVFLWSLWRDPMGANICAAAHGGSHGVAGGYSLKETAASMLVQVLLAGTAAGREAHAEWG